jgi:hypothetical protein
MNNTTDRIDEVIADLMGNQFESVRRAYSATWEDGEWVHHVEDGRVILTVSLWRGYDLHQVFGLGEFEVINEGFDEYGRTYDLALR